MESSWKRLGRRAGIPVILLLAGAGTVQALETGLSFSRLVTDSTQMTVAVSYPSPLIQSPWDVYSRTELGGAGTGGWARVGSALVLTGGVCTSWAEPLGSNQFYALGLQTTDSDGDGLSDAYELLASRTDPARMDTDGDGVTDGDEVLREQTDPLDAASCPTQTVLRASGKTIVDGSGAPVMLRGINIGGWLAYERWMVQYRPSSATSAQDDYNVRMTLDGRFGTTGTIYLLDLFRDHYLTTNDLNDLKAAGYNFLRVPFLANLLEDETNTYHYKDAGWARLDWIVGQCAARHMYCLLDMHGAPGSQNPWDHSGRENFDQLWNDADYQDRAVAMWGAIAQRYATHPAVAGYDLLNEPYQTNVDQHVFFTNNIVPLYDRMYDAIRAQDIQHIVFVESTEQFVSDEGARWWMPEPAAIGWTNVVYEFHHYDGIIGGSDSSFTYQKGVVDGLVRRYADFSEEYQVPIFLGEFNPIVPQNMDYFLRQFNANGIHWTHWNYKHWGETNNAEQPWSSWGLYYRPDGSNYWYHPHVGTDTWSDLVLKFSLYDQYALNPHLLDVVQRAAGHPEQAAEKSDFYVNTFSAHDQNNRVTPPDAWPWLKLEMSGGNDYSYVLTNHHGRLVLDWGSNIQMRLKSRMEADARFGVNDATGCWFSVGLYQLGTNSGVQLAAMRDAVTGPVWWAVSPGVIARAFTSNNTQNVLLQLHAKHSRDLGFGTILFASGWLSFTSGALLTLFVNATNALIQYDGSNYWSGAHGLDFSTWANGAAGIVEADNLSGGSTPRTFVELDTIKAWRPGAAWSGRFEDDFASHPDRLPLLAVPDHWSLLDFGVSTNDDNAYFQNGRVVVIPKRENWGITWLNPRWDFGNDLRLPVDANSAAEFRASFSRYTNANVKLCFVPEYMPRETYWLYDNPFLFAEIRDQPGGQMLFHIFHQRGISNLVSCASNIVPYTEGPCFSFQVTTNQAEIYYGTNLVVSAAHGITNFAQAFPYGLYPHLEFQNYGNDPTFTNALTEMDKVLIRPLPGFTPPE